MLQGGAGPGAGAEPQTGAGGGGGGVGAPRPAVVLNALTVIFRTHGLLGLVGINRYDSTC